MNKILKSSCTIFLTSYLLFPGPVIAEPNLTASVTDCIAEGECIGTTPLTGLNFTISGEGGTTLPFLFSDGVNNTMKTADNNTQVRIFQLPGQNRTFNFEYQILHPQECPQASGDVYNPEIGCIAPDGTATKTVSLNARITDLECVRDADNNEYALDWDSEGCGDEGVFVTLVTDSGYIMQVQVQVQNDGSITLNSNRNDLRLAYVAPVVSADGKGDGQAICQNATNPCPPPRFIRSVIHSVIPMKQPVNATADGPLGPGQVYRLMFDAPREAFISLATMKVHSNDLFLAFSEGGLPLFNETTKMPLYKQTTDVTRYLDLWDAGTEANEKPGVGRGQPLLGNAQTPADSQNWVRIHDQRFGNVPKVTDLVSVNIQHLGMADNGNHRFVLNLMNKGASFTPNPGCDQKEEVFSPGLGVVHSGGNPLFTSGKQDYGDGLKVLAEDGNPDPLIMELTPTAAGNSAVISAISKLLLAFAIFLPGIL